MQMTFTEACDALEAQEHERLRERLLMDARRYRWLREQGFAIYRPGELVQAVSRFQADQEVDRAMEHDHPPI